MTVKRYGKCATCEIPCTEVRDFPETADLFNPTDKPVIRGELSKELKAWRAKPIYCEEHKLNEGAY